jgi:hypothetical protein
MLNAPIKATFKDAAQKLTGPRKRDFMAKVAEDYFGRSARKTETVLGWNRDSVQLGLHERRSGIICVDNYRARGRLKSEEVLANLEIDIRSVVDVQAQTDPKLQSTSVVGIVLDPLHPGVTGIMALGTGRLASAALPAT